VVLRAAA